MRLPANDYRRSEEGGTPKRRLTWWARWLWWVKPTALATSPTERSVLESSSLARFTLHPITYWCGVRPVERLNCLEKWYWLRLATPAISESPRSVERLSFTKSVTRRSALRESPPLPSVAARGAAPWLRRRCVASAVARASP